MTKMSGEEEDDHDDDFRYDFARADVLRAAYAADEEEKGDERQVTMFPAERAAGPDIFAHIEVSVGPTRRISREFLVDTGANRSYVRNADLGEVVELKKPVRLETASGETSSIRQGVRTQIQWRGESMEFTFLLFPGLTKTVADGILGTDWMELMRPQVDWDRRTLVAGSVGSGESTRDILDKKTSMIRRVESRKRRMMRLTCEGQDTGETSLDPGQSEVRLAAAMASEERSVSELMREKMGKMFTNLFAPFDHAPIDRGEWNFDIVLTKPLDKSTCATYRFPAPEEEAIDAAVRSWHERGIVRQARAHFYSPLLAVRQGPKLRICIDLRKLNEATDNDNFPLPNMMQLVDDVSGFEMATVLDLSEAYLQMMTKPECQSLLGFVHHGRPYHFVSTPFGAKTAPPHFQCFMTSILSKTVDYTRIYLDDVIIFTREGGIKEHEKRVVKVLKILQDAGLHLRLTKCEFAQRKIVWLGMEIDSEGKTAPDSKRQKIIEYEKPVDIAGLRRFIGMVTFLKDSFKNLQDKMKHLTAMTKFTRDEQTTLERLRKKKADKLIANSKAMNVPIPEGQPIAVKHPRAFRTRKLVWTEEATKAFEEIKKGFQNLPRLFPIRKLDPREELLLFTDASDRAIGATVMTKEKRPIGYMSRQLRPNEAKWPVREKELWAIVAALRQWKYLLMGRRVRIMTDHRTLSTLMTQEKHSNQRVARWALEVSEFDIDIQYIKGEQNVVADALSRCCAIREMVPEDWRWSWKEYLADEQWSDAARAVGREGSHERRGEMLLNDGKICVPSDFKQRSHGTMSRHAEFGALRGQEDI